MGPLGRPPQYLPTLDYLTQDSPEEEFEVRASRLNELEGRVRVLEVENAELRAVIAEFLRNQEEIRRLRVELEKRPVT